MIKQIIDKNSEVKPNSKKMEALKAYFAGCFTKEGSFDIERFKEMMKDEVDISNEGYSLDFLGKDYANLIASIDTTTVIEPDLEHNSKPENKDSENIYISGDNLDALKHLLLIRLIIQARMALYITISSVLRQKNWKRNSVLTRMKPSESLT